MTTQLPIAISVPHAGIQIPQEVKPYCQLSEVQIVKDSDEFAAAIYYGLRDEVGAFITTDVARAIVDLNRHPGDFGKDGVIKTHTIFDEPVYSKPLPETTVTNLLGKYYYPYHDRLSEFPSQKLRLAIDCHTMAEVAPPISSSPGTKRPEICLGTLDGSSLPQEWAAILHQSFENAFSGFVVTVDNPFSGGHITQLHSDEMFWLQLEVSRSQFLANDEVCEKLRRALRQALNQIV